MKNGIPHRFPLAEEAVEGEEQMNVRVGEVAEEGVEAAAALLRSIVFHTGFPRKPP
jgi:hypothetical protein